ncbi:Na+/H+-dicarboxylate symporters [Paramagnetospirillum magneticum AMB-1]|uniref:Na+/H+-dicarboxylate symporters n=1 Tax=Paramagnetospirillum magneticum (strain ATCC 700264 / AMB-1) TaxID=342108 RepID=Q2W380_PARM1|nr:Na+/H+-dicarboxylate symporters [Paramagnetospirillum magneticum AMB-1]
MKRLTSHLYFWVLLAIFAGGTLGFFYPDVGVSLKPLGDGFIALVKMLISPVIFCTVVLGIAGAGDMKKVGRVGGKALLYFEVVSTFALVIGLIVMTVLRPGDGFHADPAALDAKAVANTPRPPPSRAPWTSSCTSSPRPWWMPSPAAAICCRCCWWPSCSAMP